MSEMTIQDFCDLNGACLEGREWAMANCRTMDEVWAKAKPDWLLWVATRPGVLTDRDLRLFAVWSARQVQSLMTDPRSIAAIDVAERHANGDATDEELDAAGDAAWAAALAAARDVALAAARDVAWAAALAAARDAAWAAARDVVWAAALAAARDVAWAAARVVAWDAAGAAQSDWLRGNTSPNFSAMEEGR